TTEWIELLEKILSNITFNTNLSNKIRFVTTTTSSSCIFGVDKDINPITKVLMVSDKRSVEEVAFVRNNHKYKLINNLVCSASSLIPKALWFKNHKPEIFDKVRYWL